MKKFVTVFLICVLTMMSFSMNDIESSTGQVTREQALAEIPDEYFDKLSDDLIELYLWGRVGGLPGSPTSIFTQSIAVFTTFDEYLKTPILSNYAYTGVYSGYDESFDFYVKDWTGIENFTGLISLYFVLDTIEDLDFTPFETFTQAYGPKYNPNTGGFDPNDLEAQSLSINYRTKPFRPYSHGGKARLYDEASELRFVNNYERLINSIKDLDFEPGTNIYVSKDNSATIMPVLKYHERFMEINKPYYISSDKVLHISYLGDSVNITQRFTVDLYEADSYVLTYYFPLDKADQIDEESPYDKIYMNSYYDFIKVMADGVDITSTYENGMEPFNTLELVISKDDYNSYYESYTTNLDSMVEGNIHWYFAEMSHNALADFRGFRSPYDSHSVKLIPPMNIFNVYYNIGDVNGDVVEVDGMLPDGIVKNPNAEFYSKKETGRDKRTVPYLGLLRPGYKLLGWYDTAAEKVWNFDIDQTNEDLFLDAIWVAEDEAIDYFVDVIFEPQNGDSSFKKTILKGSQILKPTDPIFADHTFLKWTDEASGGVAWDFNKGVNQSMTLFGQWASDKVNITFVDRDQSDTVSLDINTVVPSASVPATVRDDHTFIGWNLNEDGSGEFFDLGNPVTEDTVVYAIYEEGLKPISLINFTFVDRGVKTHLQLTPNTAVPKSEVPFTIFPGHTFIGWNLKEDGSGEYFDPNSLVTEDTIVYAIYIQNSVPENERKLPETGITPRKTVFVGTAMVGLGILLLKKRKSNIVEKY